MCIELGVIYGPGAKFLIVSDWLVYNSKCRLFSFSSKRKLVNVVALLSFYQISSLFQTRISGPMGKNYDITREMIRCGFVNFPHSQFL